MVFGVFRSRVGFQKCRFVGYSFAMKPTVVWIDNAFLQEYLRRKKAKFLTQDDDFMIGMLTKLCFEKYTGEKLIVGFKILDKYISTVRDTSRFSFSDLENILKQYRAQDEPFDFLITQREGDRTKSSAYQAKRMLFQTEEDISEKIITYLNDLWRQYGSRRLQIDLVLLITGSFDPDVIRHGIDSNTFPFRRAYFLGVFSGEMGFGELYPRTWFIRRPMSEFLPTK